MFWYPEKKIKTLVHSDDYVSAGDDASLKWLEDELSEAYELQSQSLGLREKCQKEGKVLNIMIRCSENGWEIEADPRHADLVVEQLGLTNEKGKHPGRLRQ